MAEPPMKQNRFGWAYTDAHWPPDQAREKLRQIALGVVWWMAAVGPVLFLLWLIN